MNPRITIEMYRITGQYQEGNATGLLTGHWASENIRPHGLDDVDRGVGCIELGKKTSNQTGFYEIDLSEFLISDQSTGEKRKYMVVLNRAFTCIKQLNELLGNGTVRI